MILPAWYDRERPMLIRIGSGLLGASLYIFLVFWGNGLAFSLGVAVFSVVGANELYVAVRDRKGGSPSEGLGYLACIAFQLSAWAYYGTRFARFLPAVMILLIISALISELVKHRPQFLLNIGTTLLGAVYVGWLFSFFTLLHGFTPSQTSLLAPPLANTTPGQWAVLFVSVATWGSDTGALFFGKFLGRHKMAPSISPGKTWEGSAGGLLTAVVLGTALGLWIHLPLHHAVVLALLCGVAGQIGDLCESALKRDLGIKDFGSWIRIPGHGGILDRVDSMLFAAPLAYYYLLFFLINKP